VRLGIVGVGGFGRLHARTLAGLAEAQLVAAVDRSEASLAQLRAEAPGVPTRTDLEGALRDSGAEAWIIATRTDSHVPLAVRLLEAGKAVLIEKPLAPDVATAERLAPLVTPDPHNVMLGHIALFATEFRQLVREIGRRGPLLHFHAARHRPTNHNAVYREETPLRLTMVHDLYMALVMTGAEEPSRFRARLRPRGDGGSNLALAQIEWPSGIWGSFSASFLTPAGMASDGYDRLEVFGREWAAHQRLNPQALEVWSDRAEWPLGLDVYTDPPSGWLAEELRCFCRVVRRAEPVPVGARYEDGLRVQRWLEALERSAKE
jgi:UDP-N-acetylglucosamine 3-dehydrogenase